MLMLKQITPGRVFMGKLSHDCDLLDELTEFCISEKITLGRIEGIGAVKQARIGFYDQQTREYGFHQIDSPLEITNLTGNISIKDCKPFVHAHITLANKNGNAFGGHLAPGTIVFACEVIIEEFDGPAFERGFDEETGLPLWKT
jgi:uncharacterized protein